MAGNNSNTKLLLHCNGIDTSTTFTDSSVAAPTHIVTANGNAQVDTAIKKWGTGSALFDGTGDYLSIPDSADWDIAADNTASYTVDWQMLMNTHVGTDYLIEHGDNAGTSRWWITHKDGSGLDLSLAPSGTHLLDMAPGGEITDSSWHHVAMIKVAGFYSIYKDGNQVTFGWSVDEFTLAETLSIGDYHGGGFAFDGNLDEIRFQADNYFLAAPNSFPAAPLLLYGEGVDEATTMSNDGYDHERWG